MTNSSPTDFSRCKWINRSEIFLTTLSSRKKKLIKRTNIDNRSKNIQITNDGLSIIKSLINNINKEEINFFNILGNETFNFIILLKLLLGKKIRIKANKNNE